MSQQLWLGIGLRLGLGLGLGMGLGDGLTNKLQLNYRVSCCDIRTSAIRFLPVANKFSAPRINIL